MALPYPLDRLAGCICRAQRYMGWMGPSRRGGTVCAVVAIVAWVSLLRAATATSASCPYTAYEGVDLNGGDLPNQPASKTLSTLDQCAALCCSMGFPCAAFALNAGSPNSRRLAVARNSSPLASAHLCDHLLATRIHFVRYLPVEAPSSCCSCGSFSGSFSHAHPVSPYVCEFVPSPVPPVPFPATVPPVQLLLEGLQRLDQHLHPWCGVRPADQPTSGPGVPLVQHQPA